MFSQCRNLKYLPDISNWDTSNVKIMTNIFESCISLKKLPDISKWNINELETFNKNILWLFIFNKIA